MVLRPPFPTHTHTQSQALRLCRAVHRFHFQLLVLLGSYVKLLGILQPILEHRGVSVVVSIGAPGGLADGAHISWYLSLCKSSIGNARATSDVSVVSQCVMLLLVHCCHWGLHCYTLLHHLSAVSRHLSRTH